MEQDIAGRLAAVRASLPAGVRLVAVSKFHPAGAIAAAYAAGQRHFGESRVQEFLPKAAELPADIVWHFIGHLQTNKVRRLVESRRVGLIESIDSEHILEAVDRAAAEAGIVVRVLMQVHVAREETKTGFSPEEMLDYFRHRRFEALKATHICGLMAMASNTDDTERIAADFSRAHALFTQIPALCPDLRGFNMLSMGMSDDYPLAVACGSNCVRVGSAIFGARG